MTKLEFPSRTTVEVGRISGRWKSIYDFDSVPYRSSVKVNCKANRDTLDSTKGVGMNLWVWISSLAIWDRSASKRWMTCEQSLHWTLKTLLCILSSSIKTLEQRERDREWPSSPVTYRLAADRLWWMSHWIVSFSISSSKSLILFVNACSSSSERDLSLQRTESNVLIDVRNLTLPKQSFQSILKISPHRSNQQLFQFPIYLRQSIPRSPPSSGRSVILEFEFPVAVWDRHFPLEHVRIQVSTPVGHWRDSDPPLDDSSGSTG